MPASTTSQATQDRDRSYNIRRSLPGHVEGHDWSGRMGQTAVQVRALHSQFACRSAEYGGPIRKGEVFTLLSTSNAGFSGITALGVRAGSGTFVHLGSLGAYEVC